MWCQRGQVRGVIWSQLHGFLETGIESRLPIHIFLLFQDNLLKKYLLSMFADFNQASSFHQRYFSNVEPQK